MGEIEKITNRNFFTQPAEELAKALLGKIICNRISENKIIKFRLTETEAYPHNDTAAHCNKYKSGNGVVSQKMIGGTIYVHYKNNDYPGSMFDIVSNEEGVGEGVLIRGGINIDNKNEYYKSSPRLLGEALKIDYNRLNQVDITNSNDIWLEDDGLLTENYICAKKRIGLDTATDITASDKNNLLRFILNENLFI